MTSLMEISVLVDESVPAPVAMDFIARILKKNSRLKQIDLALKDRPFPLTEEDVRMHLSFCELESVQIKSVELDGERTKVALDIA